MTLLFDDELHVHYRQFYVESRENDLFEDPTLASGGQANGLCGAAVPGFMFFTTGLHTGNVKLTIELLDAPPPVGEEWEEVVEVSFRPESDQVALLQWAGERAWPLALEPIDYRVRYCASGMDQANDQDTRFDEDPQPDRYLLQLWPAPDGPDEVLRQTSASAAYWHEHARKLPPPPTPQERAEALRREEQAREEERRQARREALEREWGGRPPSDGVLRINGGKLVARLDRDLVAGIENLDEMAQRAVGTWVARRVCAEAGLSELDWVAAALAALDQGAPLPAPFDDHRAAFDLLRSDSRVPRTAVRSYDGRHDRVSQQHMALASVWAAAKPAALTAGLEPVFHGIATFGDQYPRLLAEIRDAFPVLEE
ncbi:MAG TPA: hypothetical protein VJ914_40030 [Pseudonocardiaceae bacterium]|nr:hypothetical protein [Pseudonocardiaceae bacterium]